MTTYIVWRLPLILSALALALATGETANAKNRRLTVGPVSQCVLDPARLQPELHRIRVTVHPIASVADSLYEAVRAAWRLPVMDSMLVTVVTNDSLCLVAAKQYSLRRFGDSLMYSRAVLFRLGDSGYVATGIEGSQDVVGEIFLYFTPGWRWRGGSVRPITPDTAQQQTAMSSNRAQLSTSSRSILHRK